MTTLKILQNDWTKSLPAANSTLAIGGVSSPLDSFEVAESLVLRINICGENRHLRQARKG